MAIAYDSKDDFFQVYYDGNPGKYWWLCQVCHSHMSVDKHDTRCYNPKCKSSHNHVEPYDPFDL